jgi:hypothetical protein
MTLRSFTGLHNWHQTVRLSDCRISGSTGPQGALGGPQEGSGDRRQALGAQEGSVGRKQGLGGRREGLGAADRPWGPHTSSNMAQIKCFLSPSLRASM